jgi:SMODS-associating 2TM, beta-strand rich effector domain
VHAYATDSSRGRQAVLLLAAASILLAWLLHSLFGAAHWTAPWWLDTPAVLGFYGLLWQLYDRYAWRWRWRAVHVSDVHDLAGEWHGEVESSYNAEKVRADLMIRQTATQILVELTTDNSESASVMATINCHPGPFQGLSYVYENRPRTLNVPGMTPHSGRCHLRIRSGGRVLEGDYETDHFRTSSGRMRFERRQPSEESDRP